MAKLYDAANDTLIGTITEVQLQFLIDQLVEEDLEDQDYYIDGTTLIWFEEHDIDPELQTMLSSALGEREGMDIRWARD